MNQQFGVVFPTDDLAAAVRLLSDVLGPPDFVDGERWAQFSAGSVRFCLGAGTERPDRAALLCRVEDVAGERGRLTARGYTAEPVTYGHHELRCRVSAGAIVTVIYEPRTGEKGA